MLPEALHECFLHQRKAAADLSEVDLGEADLCEVDAGADLCRSRYCALLKANDCRVQAKAFEPETFVGASVAVMMKPEESTDRQLLFF